MGVRARAQSLRCLAASDGGDGWRFRYFRCLTSPGSHWDAVMRLVKGCCLRCGAPFKSHRSPQTSKSRRGVAKVEVAMVRQPQTALRTCIAVSACGAGTFLRRRLTRSAHLTSVLTPPTFLHRHHPTTCAFVDINTLCIHSNTFEKVSRATTAFLLDFIVCSVLGTSASLRHGGSGSSTRLVDNRHGRRLHPSGRAQSVFNSVTDTAESKSISSFQHACMTVGSDLTARR